jgi:hypothetical protein
MARSRTKGRAPDRLDPPFAFGDSPTPIADRSIDVSAPEQDRTGAHPPRPSLLTAEEEAAHARLFQSSGWIWRLYTEPAIINNNGDDDDG